MNSALVYLIRRSVYNAVMYRLARLKQLRYLVPTLVVVAYFTLILGAGYLAPRSRPAPAPGNAPTFGIGLEWGATAGIMILVLMVWLLPSKRPGLVFLEPEVDILFPAPLRRQELIRYKLFKNLLGILFSVAIMTIFATRGRAPEQVVMFGIGGFLSFTALALHQVAASFALASLGAHGYSGFKRQAPILGVFLAYAGFVVFTAPHFDGASADRFVETARAWLVSLGDSPAGAALYPFRVLALLPLSDDLAGFARHLVPVLLIIVLLYWWVLRADVAFEEASAGYAVEITRRLAALRRGKLTLPSTTGGAAAPNRWRLRAKGSPAMAFVWKNMTSLTRMTSKSFLIVMTFLVAATVICPFLFAQPPRGELLAVLLLGICIAGTGLLVFGGPSALGGGLRGDLEYVEALKTLPLTGAQLVRCELIGTTLPIVIAEFGCLIGGTVSAMALLKGLESESALVFFVSAAVMLPALTATSAIIDSAIALLLPAWVRPGEGGSPQGIEGMGQRIVMMLGKLLGLVGAFVIPGLLAASILVPIASFAQEEWLMPGIVLSALACSLALLGEVALVVSWLGQRFERLDPAAEGLIH